MSGDGITSDVLEMLRGMTPDAKRAFLAKLADQANREVRTRQELRQEEVNGMTLAELENEMPKTPPTPGSPEFRDYRLLTDAHRQRLLDAQAAGRAVERAAGQVLRAEKEKELEAITAELAQLQKDPRKNLAALHKLGKQQGELMDTLLRGE